MIEAVLRTLSVALMAWMLWLSLDRGNPETVVSSRSANLGNALRGWSLSGTAPERIAARLDSTPSPLERDWLAALNSAGSVVTWSGNLPAAGIAVRPVASPRGGFIVHAAAPERARVRITDDIGALDTANARGGGARFVIPSSAGIIEARVGGTIARARDADSVVIKRVLVFGNAGWESKFVVAAFEEDGWKVDAHMRVAPGVNVTQGSISPIDTSRYSAVIALDASAAPYATDIVRFVSSGGGVVLSGTAASIDGFSGIRAGGAGRLTGGTVLASEPRAITLLSVPLVPVVALKADALVLDRRDGAITTAVRRHVAGRVLQQGYVDTWRWRMSGDDASLAGHRAWWTRSVAGVAYAPHFARPSQERREEAPMAALVAALGESVAPASMSLGTAAGSISMWWLFGVLSMTLLGEWASRRLRGSR